MKETKTKIRLFLHFMPSFFLLLFMAAKWAVGKADRKMISPFEIWCWRKLLGITWKDHITNEYIKSVVGDQPPLVSRIDKHTQIPFRTRSSQNDPHRAAIISC